MLALCLLLGAPARAALFGAGDLRALSDAITEIDLERAQKLAAGIDSETPQFLVERGRMLLYLGDCVGAAAVFSNPATTESKDGKQLAGWARSCAHATAAGFVVEDKSRGIWLRLQDDADRVFAPFVFQVAAQARDRIGAELGVELPRPLRIDMVRDLFSLSAVTGLPLEAAETTGTLAVARFGRIIIISPQATRSGYHWEDTLAHELTHLLVTRATRDRAPLWLQEGIAKREETRWREPRPFDPKDWADETAAHALRQGRQVGIDKLGPSIAMLPTPEAAATAYAEVQSFVGFFVREQGEGRCACCFWISKACPSTIRTRRCAAVPVTTSPLGTCAGRRACSPRHSVRRKPSPASRRLAVSTRGIWRAALSWASSCSAPALATSWHRWSGRASPGATPCTASPKVEPNWRDMIQSKRPSGLVQKRKLTAYMDLGLGCAAACSRKPTPRQRLAPLSWALRPIP